MTTQDKPVQLILPDETITIVKPPQGWIFEAKAQPGGTVRLTAKKAPPDAK